MGELEVRAVDCRKFKKSARREQFKDYQLG
jgi:hypothetical protein